MVAAHPVDLRAAAKVGYRTALVRRPLEWGAGAAAVELPADFRPDLVVDRFAELADTLGAF